MEHKRMRGKYILVIGGGWEKFLRDRLSPVKELELLRVKNTILARPKMRNYSLDDDTFPLLRP